MEKKRDYKSCFSFLSTDDQALMSDFAVYMRNGVEHRFREDSIRTYLTQLATHLRLNAVPGKPVASIITRGDITRALTKIDFKQAATRRNRFFAIKTFARFLHDMGLIDDETFQAIEAMKFKSRHKAQKAKLSEEQAARITRHLLASPDYTNDQRLLMLALIATLSYVGLRNSEACRLSLEDVDFDTGTITVIDGKGGKDRTLGIPARIVPLLKLYSEHRPETSANTFFVGADGQPLDRDLVVKRMRRLSKSTDVHISAHMLRRRFATRAAHRGVPLDQLQVAMGHSDVQTTRGYVLTCENEVAEAMRSW